MKMRVLISVGNELVATEVEVASYNRTTKELAIQTPTCNYVVQDVSTVDGKYGMRDLVQNGFFDFSGYSAK